jgi:nucleoside-diphosphate-sugar epimerase
MAGGRVLVTGSTGHLGEALVRTLRTHQRDVVGLDIAESQFTTVVGSVTDRDVVRDCLVGVDSVFHTATLHKPHVGTRSRREFVDTNISGTLTLLEEAVKAEVSTFIFTSTTSTFGRALTPELDGPSAWISEDISPVPKNIYGVTKTAAENICELVAMDSELPAVVLQTSRFFAGLDDREEVAATYADENIKANEYLYRRVDIEDVVSAHMVAEIRAPSVGFAKYIVSATTPFVPEDASDLAVDAPAVVRRLFSDQPDEYARRGWTMFPGIDRVYDNARARLELGWAPRYDFRHVLNCLKEDRDPRSPLAREVGAGDSAPPQRTPTRFAE